jgi:hypothetical protein
MLNETFKERIYDSIATINPISFAIKDASEVEHTVSYTAVIVRDKDVQPAQFPTIALHYSGGSPETYIGSTVVDEVETHVEIGGEKGTNWSYTTLFPNNNPYIEFQLDSTDTLLSKIEVYLGIPTDSTSSLLCEVFNYNGFKLGEQISYYYSLSAGWFEVYGKEIPVENGYITVRLSHYDFSSNNKGINIYKDYVGNYLHRFYYADKSKVTGYPMVETLTITIEALHDESQSVAVQGYVIAKEIYEKLLSEILLWDSFPEADLIEIGKPVPSTNSDFVHNYIYVFTVPLLFRYMGGSYNLETAPYMKKFTVENIRML